MRNRDTWRGRVIGGRLKGHSVEIRVSGEPIPIYVIAYHCPRRSRAVSLDFAVGHEALRAHFQRHGLTVSWRTKEEASGDQDPRGGLAERPGPSLGGPRRPRRYLGLLGRDGRDAARVRHHRGS